MCAFAYVISMIVYQIGGLITGEAPFNLFTALAFGALAALLYLLFRRGHQEEGTARRLTSVAAAAARQ